MRIVCGVAIAMFGAGTAWAGDDESPRKISTLDLNQDGRVERVEVKGEKGAFTLTVGGGAPIKGKAPAENTIEGFLPIDLDGDPQQEIAVHTLGEMDQDHLIILFAWDGKSLAELGSVRALSLVRGNGIVLEDSWNGFWSRREKFALDRATKKLKKVPQELYAVGVEGTVKVAFEVRKSRTDSGVIASVAPGAKFTVLACDPAQLKYGAWYLVKTETGLLGWVREKTLQEQDLPFAG